MNKKEIFENIKYIKEIISSSTQYTNVSGIANIISGITALSGYIATIYVTKNNTDIHFLHPFVLIWFAVFLIAVSVNLIFMRRKAKRTEQPAWTRLAKMIVDALCPSLFVGASLSVFFIHSKQAEWLPITWMGMYGLSLWSASLFSIKEVRILSVFFIGTALLCLFYAQTHSLSLLAISFGGYHIVYGFWLYYKYGE